MDEKIIGAAVLSVLLIAVGAFLLMDGEKPQPEETPVDNESPVESEDDDREAQNSGPETREITIEAGSYYFEPEEVTVEKGTNVTFTFVNTDGSHNMRIPELNEGTKTLIDGRNRTFEVTFNEEGRYNFICSVPGHADRGMNGTIIVS